MSATTPAPGPVVEVGDIRHGSRATRVLGDGLGNGVLRRRFAAPANAENLALVSPRPRSNRNHRHHAGGDRTGLVQHHGVDRADMLEHLGALDQNAQLRPTTGADHQGGRRGQSEGAGTGDDQHGHRRGEGELRTRPLAQPEAQGGNGDRHHDRHEDRGDPVRQPLTPRLAGLRGLDQSGDLGQLGVRTHPGRLDDQPAEVLMVPPTTAAPGPTSTGIDSPVIIDVSRALRPETIAPSVAIFSPGRTTNSIPDQQRIDPDPTFGTVPKDRDVTRTELEQGAQRGAGAAASPVVRRIVRLARRW